MLNLLAISKEERAVLYKAVKKETLKKSLQVINPKNIMRIYHASYDRVKKETIIAKAEEKLKEFDFECSEVRILRLSIEVELSELFKEYSEMSALLENKKSDELNETEKTRLDEIRENYDEEKTKVPFDNLTKMLCAIDETQHNQQLKGALENKVSELERRNAELNSAYSALETTLKKQNNELEKYKAVAEKYNRLQKVEEISGTVEQLIGKVDKTFETLNDVLLYLNECETVALNAQDYEKAMKILSVKYGIAKILRGK